MLYDPLLVEPMRRELTDIGVQELRTPEEVDQFMAHTEGTALVFVNSVCGCAAGMARPALRLALQYHTKPDRVATVFAGQDSDATARARTYFAEMPPSSPALALFREGRLVRFLPRHEIESRDASEVAANLVEAFEEACLSEERG
jgi:putative YphP/YqiW family bacilliredoxin